MGNAAARSKNAILMGSELAVAGRPLHDGAVKLPRQRDLLLPESLQADSDIRVSAISRPSPEQVRAQKGRDKHISMLRSCLTINKEALKGPVLICNLTGYVEDMGSAASQPRLFCKSLSRGVGLEGAGGQDRNS